MRGSDTGGLLDNEPFSTLKARELTVGLAEATCDVDVGVLRISVRGSFGSWRECCLWILGLLGITTSARVRGAATTRGTRLAAIEEGMTFAKLEGA